MRSPTEGLASGGRPSPRAKRLNMRNDSPNNEAPQSVLLITDDVSFRCKVVESWQAEGTPPLVICLPSDLSPTAEIAWCDAVVVGPVRPDYLANALMAAAAAPAAVAFLPWGVSLQQGQLENPNLLPLHCCDDAPELAVMIGNVLLRRAAMARQLQLAESSARDCSRQAALGRFMIESRHSFNNALTTVLGTAELLLLLDSQKLDEEQREKVRTVHAMAMRLYQMIVRFSALEAEMKLAESKAYTAGPHGFLPPAERAEVQQ